MAPGSSSPASPQPFKLILGSSSVARKHILEEMGLDFQVMTADIDEKSIRRENPDELVMVLAEAKADAIMARLNIADYQKEGNKPTLLITSDIHTTGPSATKRRRVASTKRVKDSTASTAETTKKKQPAAKRFKPPMAGNKQMPPVVTSTVVVGSSPTATGSPVVTSSVVVRRSPEVRSTPVVTVPPTMRLAISPVVLQSPAHIPHNSSASPSFREERLLSSTTSPATQYPGSMSTQNKPRKLKSDIWNDMDPIYGDDGKLINARCKHCNEVFSAARNSGTSHIRRHLGLCEPRLKIHEMVEKLKSSTETTLLSNWEFDRKVTRCELVRLVVLHELPFSFVEYEGFRTYSLSLNPLAESVSRTTIKENILQAQDFHFLLATVAAARRQPADGPACILN